MRRFLICLAVLLGIASVGAADEWVGWLADEKCAVAGKAASDGHAACAKKCVGAGQPVVFVNEADKKVYKIDSQDSTTKSQSGDKVTVTSTLENDTIRVQSISAL